MIKKLITIFLYGLLLQFFLYNWATFGLGRNRPWMKVVRLWKEVFIGIFCALVLRKPGIKFIRKKLTNSPLDKEGSGEIWFKRGVILFILTIGRAAVTHLLLLGEPLSTFVLGIKYDFVGFLLVLLGYLLSHTLETEQLSSVYQGYLRVLKYILLLAILRYAVICIKPGTLKLFGYNNYIYEGQAGGQAPAAYYTHINQGIPRNQFLFERPTTRGFFLIAMWPLFFIRYLHAQPLSVTRGRRAIYGINVLITFSRAAWGARFIEIGLLGFLLHKDQRKSYLKKFLLPMIAIALFVGGLGFKQIMARGYSNRGHLTMIQKGVSLFLQHPRIGVGLASVGPGSHRVGGLAFNPENQFLQILIELGVIGFIGWMLMFVWMNWVGIYVFTNNGEQPITPLDLDAPGGHKKEKKEIGKEILLGLSIAMIGLSISGMVLHSFVDRMVVYPFCLLFGILLCYQEKVLQAPEKTLPLS